MTHDEFITDLQHNRLDFHVDQESANYLLFNRPEATTWKNTLIFFSFIFWGGTLLGVISLFLFWPLGLIILFFCWVPLRSGTKKSAREAIVKLSVDYPSFYEAALSTRTLIVASNRPIEMPKKPKKESPIIPAKTQLSEEDQQEVMANSLSFLDKVRERLTSGEILADLKALKSANEWEAREQLLEAIQLTNKSLELMESHGCLPESQKPALHLARHILEKE